MASLAQCPQTLRLRLHGGRARRAAKPAASRSARTQVRAVSGEPGGGHSDAVLNSTVLRKKRQLEAQLEELGREGLDGRLRLAGETPLQPPHRLAQIIEHAADRLVVVCEVGRTSPAQPPEALGDAAAAYIDAGADALAVRTDAEDTPTGAADLFAAVRRVRAPVLKVDYFVHPLQVVDAKEAGAAGVLGTSAYGSARGAPIVHAFAGSLGLDCPVEVSSCREAQQMAMLGVGFFGVNVIRPPEGSYEALLGALPEGALCLVAVASEEEAARVRRLGAHGVLLKQGLLRRHVDALPQLIARIRDS